MGKRVDRQIQKRESTGKSTSVDINEAWGVEEAMRESSSFPLRNSSPNGCRCSHIQYCVLSITSLMSDSTRVQCPHFLLLPASCSPTTPPATHPHLYRLPDDSSKSRPNGALIWPLVSLPPTASALRSQVTHFVQLACG